MAGQLTYIGDKLYSNGDRVAVSQGDEDISPFTMKNKLINGDFRIWQRGESSSANGYTADRWECFGANGDGNGAKSFTRDNGNYGLLPNSNSFLALSNTSTNTGYTFARQKIEDVTQFFGKEVTVSFLANSGVARNDFEIYVKTDFGVGGSTAVNIGEAEKHSLTTTVTRYTKTFTIPAYNNETIGVDNCLHFLLRFGTSVSAVQFNIAEVQLELGTVATTFEQRPIGMELSLCQRYYWKGKVAGAGYEHRYGGSGYSLMASGTLSFPTTMRIAPTVEIVTQPTYVNCSLQNTAVPNQHGFVTRVSVTNTSKYRAYNGIYTADAEL